MLMLREIVAEPHADLTWGSHEPGRVIRPFLGENQSICVNVKSESADRLYFL